MSDLCLTPYVHLFNSRIMLTLVNEFLIQIDYSRLAFQSAHLRYVVTQCINHRSPGQRVTTSTSGTTPWHHSRFLTGQAGAGPLPELRACCTPVCGIGDPSRHARVLTPNLCFRRQGEANAVDQVDARQRRCLYHHIGAVVGPHAELVVLPLHHVFMDQLMPSFGNRHSPDERGGAIGLADLELAIGHRLPQVSDRIGIPIPNSLEHAIMETRSRYPEVAGVAAFQTILGTFQDEPTMRPRTLPN